VITTTGRIDCHVHYYASKFADLLLPSSGKATVPIRAFVSSRAGWRDLDALREVMDETGVGLGVIVGSMANLNGLRRAGAGASEAYNRSLSEDMAPSEGRFLACAHVDPMGGRDEVAQLDRSLKQPHMAGIGLVTSYDGIALDDPLFEPIFEVARAHDAPIMVHPADAWREALRLDHNVLETGFGFLMDDALTLMRMALKGTFDKYPDVRFMFCQLGGFAPGCCARWDFHVRQYRLMGAALNQPLPEWAKHTFVDYLRHVWLDTHSQDRHIMRLVLDLLGDDNIVLGGDYPLTVPEDGVHWVLQELGALGVSPETVHKIERDNALRLLGSRAG